ncbi:MAG: hypothetical protein ACLTLI_08010 [Clostridia bacterium]
MVISEFVRETAKQLGDNARFEAELMVMSVMEMDRTRLVLNGKLPVMPQHTYRMNKMIERRKKGEPLQYILGETEFMSLDFLSGRVCLYREVIRKFLLKPIDKSAMRKQP